MDKGGIIILDNDFELVPEENIWYKADEAFPSPFADIIFCTEREMYLGTFDSLNRYVDKTGQSIENVLAWMPAPTMYEKV